MKNDNQDKIIKEKFNQYIDNIEIPKNLEEVIMKNMKDIEKNEMLEREVQEKAVKGKTFNFKRFLGSAAAVVVIAGVATITSFEMGWIGEKQNKNVVAEKQSEAGKNTLLASNEQIKSLYDIQEYTDNLTDAANGKLAFLKLLENNELPLEEEDYYYVYKDDTYGMMIGNAYYIKEITNVTSEEGMMGNDDWAALFKVTVEYINDNDETKTFDLAIILLPNHEVQNKGTYANYTGTTEFVKGFTDLYQEEPEENSNVVIKEEYLKVWETDPADTEIQLYENGIFVTDHYTKSSEIKGNYTIQGNEIELVTEDGQKWKGRFLTEAGKLTLSIEMNGEELKFYDMKDRNDNEVIDEILYELENGEATVSFSIGTYEKYMKSYPVKNNRISDDAQFYSIGNYGKLDYLSLGYDKNDKIDNIVIVDAETKEGISTTGNTTFEKVEKFYKDNKYINIYKCKDVPGVDIDIILVQVETEFNEVTIRHDFENDILKNITVYEENPEVIEQLNKENKTEENLSERDLEIKIEELFKSKIMAINDEKSGEILDCEVEYVTIEDELSKQQILDIYGEYYNEDDILAYVTYSIKTRDGKTPKWINETGGKEGEWLVGYTSFECLRDGKLVNNSKISVNWQMGDNDALLIEELFLRKLNRADATNEEHLLDYKIESVKVLSQSEKGKIIKSDKGYKSDDVLAYVTYSVKPKDIKTTNWIAGNGRIEEEWITNKVSCECLRDGKLVNKDGFVTGW